MARYSAHFLDGNKQIVKLTFLDCVSDKEASRQAAALVGEHTVELWRDQKRLRRFDVTPPKPKPKPSAEIDSSERHRRVEARLEEALACHRAGDLVEAEARYMRVLRADKRNARALTLLGTLHAQQGKFEDSIRLLNRSLEISERQPFALNSLGNALNALGRHEDALSAFGKSIALKPDQPAPLSNAGNALRALNRHKEALAAYRKAITIDPNYAEAHSNRGDLLRELERYDDAVASYGKAIALCPDSVRDWFGKAAALQASDRLEEALESYDRVIALKSDFSEAWNNRGNVLAKLQRHDQALECYENAVRLNSDYVQAYNNWGNALRALQRFEEALARYEQAIARKPDYVEAYSNRGLLLEDLGRHLDALASHEKAAELEPGNPEFHRNRGNILHQLKRYDAAVASYDKAIAIKSDDAVAHHARGITLRELKRFKAALASFDAAIALSPGYATAYFNKSIALKALKQLDEALDSINKAIELDPKLSYALGYRLSLKLDICDWNGRHDAEAEVIDAIERGSPASVPFSLLAVSSTPEIQRKCAQLNIDRRFASPTAIGPSPTGRAARSVGERIRVAYVSANFHPHPVARHLAGIIENHDANRFETIGVSLTGDDESDIRSRISGAFHHFVDVKDKSDDEVAAMLRDMGVDIAIDLMAFTLGGRPGIFARRAAPIQVNYFGYPGTTGAGYVDYLIADKTVIPEPEQSCYSEKIVYLPDSYIPNDSKRPVDDAPDRAELGLPETGFVFCSINQNYKFTPEIFDIWMRLLSAVENSVLWLPQSTASGVRNLVAEAEARGIAPNRLVFAPYVARSEDHLARLRQADLFLDTLPYNAHSTACEALWAGLPVLTCVGKTFAGRVAASLLNAVGLPEMVTSSLDEYEARALTLACDRAALAEVKAKLARNRGTYPLFDTVRFARHLEAAFTAMVERQQAGMTPIGFAVERKAAEVENVSISDG